MSRIVVYIGSDHRGFLLKSAIKEHLAGRGCETLDVGPFDYDRDDDFIDYAGEVCKETLKGKGMGILICGSGHGMCIAANKMKGIRAALCWNEKSGRWAREHQDANVLCLAGQISSVSEATSAVDAWLDSKFSGEERHARRINRLNEM